MMRWPTPSLMPNIALKSGTSRRERKRFLVQYQDDPCGCRRSQLQCVAIVQMGSQMAKTSTDANHRFLKKLKESQKEIKILMAVEYSAYETRLGLRHNLRSRYPRY